MADNLVKALSQENLRQIINILMTMNKSDESTGVKVYANGEEYLKDDIVVYLQENATDYTLLICTTTHTSSTDIPDMLNFATVDSTVVENFTDEEIAELFDLSEEEAVELTKLIDDVHIAINKIYSNQRTEERITEILAEANEYATKLLGNANFLTVEIVTSESEVTSNNVLYLIADGQGANTYNQFILVDGEIKSLGSTSIDLSNYHTKDEITTLLADYAKKNEVLSSDNIVTTIDETVTNTQIGGALAVKEYVDTNMEEVVKKDDIVTTLDSTATDEQVPSAKAVYERTKDTNIKTYSKLEELGLTAPVTTFEVFSSMPSRSFANIPARANGNQLISDLPETTCNGILIVDKYDNNCFSVMFKRSNGTGFDNYLSLAHFNTTDGSNFRWDKICTNEWKTGIEIYSTTQYSDDILKFPVGKYYIHDANVNSFSNLPEQISGTLEIFSTTPNSNLDTNKWCFRTYKYTTYAGDTYTRGLYTADTAGTIYGDSDWRRVCTCRVKDVNRTTFSSPEDTRLNIANSFYYVKNGVCTITFNGFMFDSVSGTVDTYKVGKVPKPLAGYAHTSLNYSMSAELDSQIVADVGNDGGLSIYVDKNAKTGVSVWGTLRYDVAE